MRRSPIPRYKPIHLIHIHSKLDPIFRMNDINEEEEEAEKDVVIAMPNGKIDDDCGKSDIFVCDRNRRKSKWHFAC